MLSSIATPWRARSAGQLGFVWSEIGDLMDSVAGGLIRISEAAEQITKRTVHMSDWFKGRSRKDALTALAQRLSIVISDQQRVVQSLDAYGDLWRSTHSARHKASRVQQGRLLSEWEQVVSVLRSIANTTKTALQAVRSADKDLSLEESYTEIQEALDAKSGLLARMARMPPPGNIDEMNDLVEGEEKFIRLRVEAKSAQRALNAAIARIDS